MAYEPVTQLELLRYRSARPGVRVFMNVMLFLFKARGMSDVGIYNRRAVRGGKSWSLHAVGRAADLGVNSKALGDEIADRLVRAAAKLGICEVIWYRRRWTAEKGWQSYHGADNHTTHVHVGFTRDMAGKSDTADGALSKWMAAAVISG